MRTRATPSVTWERSQNWLRCWASILAWTSHTKSDGRKGRSDTTVRRVPNAEGLGFKQQDFCVLQKTEKRLEFNILGQAVHLLGISSHPKLSESHSR